MPYIPLATVATNDPITVAWGNQVKDNLASGVPDIMTTKGDLAVASGSDAASRLGVGSDYQVLQSRAGATLGVEWSSGIVSLCSKSGAQSISTGSMTKIQVASAVSDASSMLDGTNFRLTIPVGFPTRLYMIMAEGYFTGHATVDKYRHLEIQKNGTAYCRQSSQQDDGSEAVGLSVISIVSLAATDYIEAWVKQNSGGALNFNDCRLGLFMIR